MRPPALKIPARRPELRGNVKPVANPVFGVSAQDGSAVITVFAEIGGETGVTAEGVNRALAEIGPKAVTLKINSYGGDAYEGVAIYNLLRAHPQTITVQVLGIAASAASIIAMAGDRIEMARNSEMMIHKAWMVAVGNADLFKEAAEFLDKLDGAIAGTYAARSGQALAKIQDLMSDETFMSADEAIDLGFADGLLAADADPAPVALADANPQTRRDLEARLRQIGFSKSAAAKVVAGGWPALEGQSQPSPHVEAFIAKINSATSDLKKGRMK